jgi:hypothetical protein
VRRRVSEHQPYRANIKYSFTIAEAGLEQTMIFPQFDNLFNESISDWWGSEKTAEGSIIF